MITPEVTAVVPTHNRRALLAETVASILGQRDVDVRLVVVDEASSDDTPAWLAAVAARDPRVTTVRNDEPQGVGPARNAGLSLVATPWVAFCDDDDLWAPDKLASQLAAIAAVPGARWSVGGSVSIDRDRRVVGHQRPPASGDVSTLLRAHNAMPGGGSGLLVDTDLARQLDGYDPWFLGCCDYEIAVRLSRVSPIATVDRPLVGYRVWPGTESWDPVYMRAAHDRVLDRWRGDLDAQLARHGDLTFDAYLGRFYVRARDRRGAAWHHTRMALRYRQPRLLATALLSAVAPDALAARRDRTEREAVPAAWVAEASQWLDAPVEAVSAS